MADTASRSGVHVCRRHRPVQPLCGVGCRLLTSARGGCGHGCTPLHAVAPLTGRQSCTIGHRGRERRACVPEAPSGPAPVRCRLSAADLSTRRMRARLYAAPRRRTAHGGTIRQPPGYRGRERRAYVPEASARSTAVRPPRPGQAPHVGSGERERRALHPCCVRPREWWDRRSGHRQRLCGGGAAVAEQDDPVLPGGERHTEPVGPLARPQPRRCRQ